MIELFSKQNNGHPTILYEVQDKNRPASCPWTDSWFYINWYMISTKHKIQRSQSSTRWLSLSLLPTRITIGDLLCKNSPLLSLPTSYFNMLRASKDHL